MFLLCILAQKGRSDRDSVETITSQLSVGITLGKVSDASQIAESRQQVVKANWVSFTAPALICSGHQAINGMRMPPS